MWTFVHVYLLIIAAYMFYSCVKFPRLVSTTKLFNSEIFLIYGMFHCTEVLRMERSCLVVQERIRMGG